MNLKLKIDNYLNEFSNIREQFPYLKKNQNLVYLDSAATTQKPETVINALGDFYTSKNANINRGVYSLSQVSSEAYNNARLNLARFISARSSNEIVFLKGATEGFNLLANSFLKPRLEEGDEIILSVAEHHANIVPWQIVCNEVGATIKVLPLKEDYSVQVEALNELITKKTKLISLIHVSNTLGSLTDVHLASHIAKAHSIPLVIDGSQAVSHLPVNVKDIDCDFYLFSGHKLYGPTGIGVLYGKEELLNEMPPYQTGGDMIEIVDFSGSTFKNAPQRFEAGTPPIAGAIGLSAAIDFINSIGFGSIINHEYILQNKLISVLNSVDGLKVFYRDKELSSNISDIEKFSGPVSFIADWAHPHDIGTILDAKNIAVRTGHHCTQPLMKYLNVNSTTRVSLGLYSNEDDIERLYEGLLYARKILS